MEHHAIVDADTTGTIHLWSPGAEELFGNTATEAVGQSLDLIVPEEFSEQHWAGFHGATRSGKSRLDGAAHPRLPVRCKDGTVRTLPGRFIFLRDPNDRAVGAMAIYMRSDE